MSGAGCLSGRCSKATGLGTGLIDCNWMALKYRKSYQMFSWFLLVLNSVILWMSFWICEIRSPENTNIWAELYFWPPHRRKILNVHCCNKSKKQLNRRCNKSQLQIFVQKLVICHVRTRLGDEISQHLKWLLLEAAPSKHCGGDPPPDLVFCATQELVWQVTISEALNAADHSVIEMSIPATKTSSETFKSRERGFVLLGFLKGKHDKTEETEIHSQQESLLSHGLSTVTPTMYPPTLLLWKRKESSNNKNKKKKTRNYDTSVSFNNI